MKCISKKNLFSRSSQKGFSLFEVMGALLILAIICSGVFSIIERCAKASADMEIQMQAFDVAQQNMEKILCTRPVTEKVDYGLSEIYPAIQWQTVTEIFDDIGTNDRMWVRAISTAEYRNSEDELKKIEFTHWISQLTEEQIRQFTQQDDQSIVDQLIATIEDASDYAGVDIEVIEQWESNGMTKEGTNYIKKFLDLYKETNGNPSQELITKATEEYDKIKNKPIITDRNKDGSPLQNPIDPKTQKIPDSMETIPDAFN